VSKITEKEVLEVIESLEIRVDKLIQKCDQLNIENQSLKENNQELSKTQQSVLKKNNLAKSKAETILERLRSIEDSA
jgi:cell division protein ZapB